MKQMKTFTISIPNELKAKLDQHKDINWAEYIKKRFVIKIKQLHQFEELMNKGEI